jgi:hypothetical protein
MNAEWLRKKFEEYPHKTKAGLARAIGLEPPAISKILANTRQVKAQEYISMCSYFDAGDHFQQVGESDTFLNQKQQGFSDKDRIQDAQWDMPESLSRRQTSSELSVQHTIVFQVQEKAMEPDYQEDAYIAVDLSRTTPSPSGIFLVSDGYGRMIRHCEKIDIDGEVHIRISAIADGFTAQTLKLNEFTVLGQVIGKIELQV